MMGMSVEGAGWKDGSGIGSCEKSGGKSGVDADKGLLMIKGSVPGSRNSIVEVRTDV